MYKYIKKRDGRTEDFKTDTFNQAIENAATAVGHIIDIDVVSETAIQILKENNTSDTTTVEESLDAIEISLMKNNYPDVAKAFIIYRNKHARQREQNSVFTKAIDLISLDFEIKGNAAEFLWEIAHITSYYYSLYKILPQKITHYFTENYIWIHSLPYFGRTIRNISYDLEEVFKTEYFKKKNMNPPKRVMVLMNHIIQLDSAIHDDIGGEHVYQNFDISINNLIENLSQKPNKSDIQQAAEYFVYTLNNASVTHTRNKVKTPCINIGKNTSEPGNIFIECMLDSLLKISENGVYGLPYIVYKINNNNWSDDSNNKNILHKTITLAQKRGNVSFVWDNNEEEDNVYFSNGLKNQTSQSVNLQLTLNLPKIALNSKDNNLYGNINLILDIIDEIVSMNTKMLNERTIDNFPTINQFKINEKYYSGETKFSNIFNDSIIVIGMFGLMEAIKILNPDLSLLESSEQAELITNKLKKRIHLQNKKYKLMPIYDLKIVNAIYDGEKQRSQLSNKGITGYSPGITLLPIGYNVKDRINLEEKTYANFDMPVQVLILKDRDKGEILEGIQKIKDKNAMITII